MSVRVGHEWYSGEPGTWNAEHLLSLSERWLACPDCTTVDFTEGRCHTQGIINAFKQKFPSLQGPQFASANTKVIEGDGGLRDVLITKNAIFAGCKPPRGAPTSKELGITLPCSVFGNPEVMAKIRQGIERGKEERAKKKHASKYGGGAVDGNLTMKYDLPRRTPAEAEAERRACFDKAWAQKRARSDEGKKKASKKQA